MLRVFRRLRWLSSRRTFCLLCSLAQGWDAVMKSAHTPQTYVSRLHTLLYIYTCIALMAGQMAACATYVQASMRTTLTADSQADRNIVLRVVCARSACRTQAHRGARASMLIQGTPCGTPRWCPPVGPHPRAPMQGSLLVLSLASCTSKVQRAELETLHGRGSVLRLASDEATRNGAPWSQEGCQNRRDYGRVSKISHWTLMRREHRPKCPLPRHVQTRA